MPGFRADPPLWNYSQAPVFRANPGSGEPGAWHIRRPDREVVAPTGACAAEMTPAAPAGVGDPPRGGPVVQDAAPGAAPLLPGGRVRPKPGGAADPLSAFHGFRCRPAHPAVRAVRPVPVSAVRRCLAYGVAARGSAPERAE